MHPSLPFHIQKLKQIFDERRARNKRYSLRSYARDLGMSPAALSRLLSAQKGLSKGRAQSLVKKLHFTRQESQLFLLSVASCYSRRPQDRQSARQKFDSIRQREAEKAHLAIDAVPGSLSWEHLALMELLEVENRRSDLKWFAKKLGQSEDQIQRLLNDLIGAKMIALEDGHYKAASPESETTFDRPSLAFQNYHSRVMEKAQTALFNDDVSKREFINMTFAFSSDLIDEVKENIRDYQESFAKRFYSPTKQKDSVYQLSVHFFRLDKELPEEGS